MLNPTSLFFVVMSIIFLFALALFLEGCMYYMGRSKLYSREIAQSNARGPEKARREIEKRILRLEKERTAIHIQYLSDDRDHYGTS
jgi:hypothetical protein